MLLGCLYRCPSVFICGSKVLAFAVLNGEDLSVAAQAWALLHAGVFVQAACERDLPAVP